MKVGKPINTYYWSSRYNLIKYNVESEFFKKSCVKYAITSHYASLLSALQNVTLMAKKWM